MFGVGDKVTWTSQAGGSAKTKTGIVVAVIPGGAKSCEVVEHEIRKRERAGTHRSAYGGGWSRPGDSYLVEVPQGPKAKPVLYWPKASALQKA